MFWGRRGILDRSVLEFVMFSCQVNFDAAFGDIAVIAKKASGFDVIFDADLHSNFPAASFHL